MQRFWEKIKDIFLSKGYSWRRVDYPLIAVVLLMGGISAFTLWIIGSGYNTSANYKKQLIGFALGLFIIAVVALIDYHFICRFAIIYYILVTGMVAATRFSPLGSDNDTGAFRWVKIGGFDLQPSELCKIMIIISLAVVFNSMQNRLKTFWPLLASVVVVAVPLLLILKQPDLSSSLVIVFILIMMIIASGESYKILLPLAAIGIPLLCFAVWYVVQPGNNILEDYQVGRILGFIYPDKYPATMYQQNNSIDAIASGGLYGKFIVEGTSNIRNYNRVDVTESDFIWAAFGEEYGFIGCIAVIIVLILFVMLCARITKNASDYLGKMIAVGISSMFMFQIFVNIGVATRMLPNTGLPLPFISSGLSALISYSIAVGILINIKLQPMTKAMGGGFIINNEARNLAVKNYNDYSRIR